ncbi:hypothetical protein AB3S75_030908 [Citrus x aurantiifolia]
MSEEKKPAEPPPQPQQEQPIESTPTLPRTYGQLLGPNAASIKTWPGLVGLTAEEAEKKIKEERPGAQVQVVPPNSFVTMDFRHNRVRLHVDFSGKVERPPNVG